MCVCVCECVLCANSCRNWCVQLLTLHKELRDHKLGRDKVDLKAFLHKCSKTLQDCDANMHLFDPDYWSSDAESCVTYKTVGGIPVAEYDSFAPKLKVIGIGTPQMLALIYHKMKTDPNYHFFTNAFLYRAILVHKFELPPKYLELLHWMVKQLGIAENLDCINAAKCALYQSDDAHQALNDLKIAFSPSNIAQARGALKF